VINAFVPLANMFGYLSTLNGMSQGRARFTIQYAHYAPVPVPPPDDDPRFPPAMAMRA
jgi:elongation factor G